MDHITTHDGAFLEDWKTIQHRQQPKFKGPIPGWYKEIKKNHTYDNGRLHDPLPHSNIINPNVYSKMTVYSLYKNKKSITTKWNYHWNQNYGVIIGKPIEFLSHSSLTMVVKPSNIPRNIISHQSCCKKIIEYFYYHNSSYN